MKKVKKRFRKRKELTMPQMIARLERIAQGTVVQRPGEVIALFEQIAARSSELQLPEIESESRLYGIFQEAKRAALVAVDAQLRNVYVAVNAAAEDVFAP